MRTRPQTEFQTENFRFSIEFFHFLTVDAYPFWLITVHIICDQCSVCTYKLGPSIGHPQICLHIFRSFKFIATLADCVYISGHGLLLVLEIVLYQ